jgi:hypothetical protein
MVPTEQPELAQKSTCQHAMPLTSNRQIQSNHLAIAPKKMNGATLHAVHFSKFKIQNSNSQILNS